MSATPRPNLGGLFNGSTPPDRSSSIAAALRASESGDQKPTDASGSARSPGAARSSGATDSSSATGSSTSAGSPGSARTKRSTPTSAAAAPPMGAPVPPLRSTLGAGRDATEPWAALQWLDPVRVLGFYFDVLQAAFDAQRRVTMSVASVVSAPVRRAGIWR